MYSQPRHCVGIYAPGPHRIFQKKTLLEEEKRPEYLVAVLPLVVLLLLTRLQLLLGCIRAPTADCKMAVQRGRGY